MKEKIRNKHLLFLIFSTGFLAACGIINIGTYSPNSQPPNGTALVSGSFTSLNGKTVTGIATIYAMGSGSGSYAAYLNGISAPNESGLIVEVNGNSGLIYSSALQSSSGSQTYYFTASGSPSWLSVTLHSTTYNMDYGTALLH